MGSKEELVDFIQEELEKRNWSHADLARRSGISQAHISRVIHSDHKPGLTFYKSISSAFNIHLEDILRISGELPGEATDIQNQQVQVYFSKINEEDQRLILLILEFLAMRNHENKKNTY